MSSDCKPRPSRIWIPKSIKNSTPSRHHVNMLPKTIETIGNTYVSILIWCEVIKHVRTTWQGHHISPKHCVLQQYMWNVCFSQRFSNRRSQIAGDLKSHDLKSRDFDLKSRDLNMLRYIYIYLYSSIWNPLKCTQIDKIYRKSMNSRKSRQNLFL